MALHFNSASQSTVDSLLAAVTAAQKTHGSSSARAQAFRADLSNMDAVRTLHAAVVSALGAPEILFLNAGSTAGLSGITSISEIPFEAFEATWRINTASPFLLTQLCLPAMEKAEWGRVVFNSSVAGITGGVVGGHYASSKAAVHGLVHWLAGSVAKKGITVNAVAPALIEDTAMLPSGGEELAKSKLMFSSLCASSHLLLEWLPGWVAWNIC